MTLKSSDRRPMYQYQALNHLEIRLLEIIRSSSDHDVISYKIVHFQLDQAPEYETVSYVWGKSHDSSNMALFDGSVLPVTTSISTSLSTIAKTCRTNYLWIDQLTINQRNTSERNAQVKIMGEIFRRCSRCLIWLGADAQWAHHIGQAVGNFLHLFADEHLILKADLGQNPMTETRGFHLPSLSNESDYLLWFFEHEWFRRTWVFQEFVLSPQTSFLFGDFEVPGEILVQSFIGGWVRGNPFSDTFKRNLSQDMAIRFHNAPIVKFMIAAVTMQNSLPGLRLALEETEETETRPVPRRYGSSLSNYESITYANALDNRGASSAHDDRDHVYALLGLAPCLLKHMQVDYTLSVEEAFAAMMKALVKESKSLDFFANLPCESDISKSKLRLPSWVSNWTYTAPHVKMLSYDCQFNACGEGFGLPSIMKCEHTEPSEAVWNELQVAGKIIDTVSFVLRPYSPYQVEQAEVIDFRTYTGLMPWEMSTLHIIMADLREHSIEAAQNATVKDLLRTLLMDGVRWAMLDMLSSGISGKDMYRKERVVLNVSHMEKTEAVITVLIEHKDPDYDDLPYSAGRHTLHELSRVQYRRRLAYCAAGRLALAPDLVETGDSIAILHGSRTPVVLRARPNGKYAVVGQCYYDGAMYGELADLDDGAASIFTLV